MQLFLFDIFILFSVSWIVEQQNCPELQKKARLREKGNARWARGKALGKEDVETEAWEPAGVDCRMDTRSETKWQVGLATWIEYILDQLLISAIIQFFSWPPLMM